MVRKKTNQDMLQSTEEEKERIEEEIEYDWKDVLAFIIAAFQVILPYALILTASVFIIMLLFSFLTS